MQKAVGPDAKVLLLMSQPASNHMRILGRLVGTWDYVGSWGANTDSSPTRTAGHYRNNWQLEGRSIESIGYDDTNAATSKVTYGYDPRFSEYYAFAINSIVPHYDLEKGNYDPDHDQLVFTATEYFRGSDLQIHFARTIVFDGPDRLKLTIDYPGSDNPAYGELHLELVRRQET